jgi:hypothetical protein
MFSPAPGESHDERKLEDFNQSEVARSSLDETLSSYFSKHEVIELTDDDDDDFKPSLKKSKSAAPTVN